MVLLIALTCGLGLCADKARGDGPEYLLMAHALATRLGPDIRASDASWLGRREPDWARASHRLELGMRDEELTPLPPIRRADDGPYYSIHFWFYSLLAVPFLFLTELFHLTPWRALGALNGVLASAAICVLWVHFERGRFALLAGLLFLLAGTTFYLPWTGPEVLTGATAVIACLRAREGNLAGGLLAGAIASVQNASAGALLPFTLWTWWPRRGRLSRAQIAISAAAVCVAALPYAYFYAHYHMPSIAGHFATNPKLIGFQRAWSFVFDLNQGLVLGLPGILAGLLVVPVLAVATGARPSGLLAEIAPTLVLVATMATPTLAVHNWNMGESVIIRYGYWSAMPLVVLLLELAFRLPLRLRSGFTVGVGAVQMAAIVPHGIIGQHYSYLRHSWAAKAAFRHFPQAYDPWPEIFYERTRGREGDPEGVILLPWPSEGPPCKILRDGTRPPLDERLCPGGGLVTSDHVRDMGDDWLYLDPPFRCSPAPTASAAAPGGSVAPSLKP